MYLSKIIVYDESVIYKLNSYKYYSNAYYMHQVVRSFFSDSYIGSPLFRSTIENKRPVFYVLSKEEPIMKKNFSILIKPYSPKVTKGEQLSFTLTANPTILERIEGKEHSVRYDIWMDTRVKAKQNGETKDNIYIQCYEKTKEWLDYKSNLFGFKPVNLMIERYLHHNFVKPNDQNKVSFGAIDYKGIIEVTDSEMFIERALFRGIGASKAFGCGLMLIKRLRNVS